MTASPKSKPSSSPTNSELGLALRTTAGGMAGTAVEEAAEASGAASGGAAEGATPPAVPAASELIRGFLLGHGLPTMMHRTEEGATALHLALEDMRSGVNVDAAAVARELAEKLPLTLVARGGLAAFGACVRARAHTRACAAAGSHLSVRPVPADHPSMRPPTMRAPSALRLTAVPPPSG